MHARITTTHPFQSLPSTRAVAATAVELLRVWSPTVLTMQPESVREVLVYTYEYLLRGVGIERALPAQKSIFVRIQEWGGRFLNSCNTKRNYPQKEDLR